jgi:hypothetical protein
MIVSSAVFGQTNFDTTLDAKVKLMDIQSTVRYLRNFEAMIYEDEGLPRVQFYDATRSAYVLLFCNPGSNSKKVAQIEIGYYKNLKDTSMFHLIPNEIKIKSESLTELGMSIERLIQIKGRPTSVNTVGRFRIFKYKLNDTRILERYNMPIYEANYYFQKGKLIRYSFGFPYL